MIKVKDAGEFEVIACHEMRNRLVISYMLGNR
jgi:hypothetical protein